MLHTLFARLILIGFSISVLGCQESQTTSAPKAEVTKPAVDGGTPEAATKSIIGKSSETGTGAGRSASYSPDAHLAAFVGYSGP